MKKLFLIMTLSALLSACAGDDMPKVQLPEIDTTNPLLAEWETPHATPPFDKISISDYEPAFETAIAVSRAEEVSSSERRPVAGSGINRIFLGFIDKRLL